MAKEAVDKTLDDAGVDYSKIEQAAVGYVYGESTRGQRALYVYYLGMTGIPIYNVNNNCATGASALSLVSQLMAGGHQQHRSLITRAENPCSQFQDLYIMEQIHTYRGHHRSVHTADQAALLPHI